MENEQNTFTLLKVSVPFVTDVPHVYTVALISAYQLIILSFPVRLFLVRCKGCAEGHLSGRAGDATQALRVFHLRCFCCCVCRLQATEGRPLCAHGGQAFLARDYHNQLASPTTSDSGIVLNNPGPGTPQHCSFWMSSSSDTLSKVMVPLLMIWWYKSGVLNKGDSKC